NSATAYPFSIPSTLPSSLLSTPAAAQRFRDLYMSRMTQAFGGDLDKIRREEGFDDSRLAVLVNSLEAGVDIFTEMEKEIGVLGEGVE
ncbi:ribosome-assembly protein 3-domain-containing protein, partial [Jimgerdemannia flammicorona]